MRSCEDRSLGYCAGVDAAMPDWLHRRETRAAPLGTARSVSTAGYAAMR